MSKDSQKITRNNHVNTIVDKPMEVRTVWSEALKDDFDFMVDYCRKNQLSLATFVRMAVKHARKELIENKNSQIIFDTK